MKIESRDLRSRKFVDKSNENRKLRIIHNNLARKEPFESKPSKEKETYDIHEYAESVGPQGLQIVINKHAPTTRKAIWFLIMFGKIVHTNNSLSIIRWCSVFCVQYSSLSGPLSQISINYKAYEKFYNASSVPEGDCL